VATGPTQSGKTLCAYVIPLLYHLFEIGETVICGLPNMDMAGDKWLEDILPVIERSQYRSLLPRAGAGSRGGGKLDAVRFGNGVTLKFMSGGGGDKQRAGFTSRVVVITETDGMDEQGGASREADKITQLEARTMAYGSRKRIYMECTVSIEQGRTWRELKAGTDSRIVLPCAACRQYVSLEREHLIGWQDAESKVEAREKAAFICPACGVVWSHQDRIQANRNGLLLHRGEEIGSDGQIVGGPPATDTLGFRWSAVNNLFVTAGDIGADEWRASRALDEDNAEREMRQFVWALPHVPPVLDTTPLDPNAVARRLEHWPRGLVPEWAEWLTCGVDVHLRHIEYVVIAWKLDGTGHIVDYGRFQVVEDEPRLSVEAAILMALREVRDECRTGWARSEGGAARMPDQVWIDRGFQGAVVDAFCLESKEPGGHRFRPIIGRGAMQQRMTWYVAPKKRSKTIRIIGEGYHIGWRQGAVPLVEINSDYWKTWVHQRLNTAEDVPGALTLFHASPREHRGFVMQLTAEKRVEEMVPGRGEVVRWERIRRDNHYLDCAYVAAAAAHACGVRLLPIEKQPVIQAVQQNVVERDNGATGSRVARLREQLIRNRR